MKHYILGIMIGGILNILTNDSKLVGVKYKQFRFTQDIKSQSIYHFESVDDAKKFMIDGLKITDIKNSNLKIYELKIDLADIED